MLVDFVWRDGRRFDFPVVRCLGCGFTYVTPHGVGEVLGNVSGGGAWSAAATVNRTIYASGLRRLAGSGMAPGSTILDLGCGYGDFLAFAEARGFRVVGMDLDPAAAERARARGFEVLTGDLRGLAIGQEVDALTMWDVIEHVDDPVGLLRTAAGVLRPGGLLFFHTGNARFQIPKARVMKTVRPMGGPYLASHQHVSHFEPASARRALEAAGLEPLDVFYAGTLRYPQWKRRVPMSVLNAVLSLSRRVGGPLLTSAMGVIARRSGR